MVPEPAGEVQVEGRSSGPPGSSFFPRRLLWVAGAAVVLRVLLLLGRGHYVAFDEGWYLLLGENLWSGDGYTLSGLRHVALSPLFPILAGALDWIIDDVIWAGRLIAAVSAGLLVVPCWYIFHRLAGRRVALLGAVLVAFVPSLAPFVVPYWIGWDLWVGAEPLLHLFLFTGLAFFLHAWEARSIRSALACGGSVALAYLARPEAIGLFALLGILAVGFAVFRWKSREPEGHATSAEGAHGLFESRPVHFVACGLAFIVISAPYWLYLHDSLDRWTITGRWIQVTPPTPSPTGVSGAGSNRIEDMLWEGDASDYIRSLYSLNRPGTALANGYWGIRPDRPTPPADRAGTVDSAGRNESLSTATTVSPSAPPRSRIPGDRSRCDS